MKSGRAIGALIAMTASASAHLALLNAFSDSPPPVLIKGGSLQVEIGLNSASSTASATGAQEAVPEHKETSDAQNAAPEKPDPLPNPEPVAEAEPAAEAKPAPPDDKVIAPVATIESSRVSTTEMKAESTPKPEPEAAAPHEMSSSAPDQSEQSAAAERSLDATAQKPPATTKGGAPSAPSVGSSSGDAGPAQPAAKAGNADSENYAGQVMEHLSRVRRPRASVPGSALVAFTIASSGELESVSIVKSSGSSKFDRDALKMVERAAPFPKPPSGVNREFVVEIEGS